jgi:hypothetical protein
MEELQLHDLKNIEAAVRSFVSQLMIKYRDRLRLTCGRSKAEG